MPETTRRPLIEVAKRYGVVACVSGRRASDARRIVSLGSIAYLGSHGSEVLRPGAIAAGARPRAAGLDAARAGRSPTRRSARRCAGCACGSRTRRRSPRCTGAACRTRTTPQAGDRARSRRRAEEAGFTTHWGRKVLEIRPPVRIDKGAGIVALLRDTDLAAAIYVGDDVTDLDAFRGLTELRREGRLGHARARRRALRRGPVGARGGGRRDGRRHRRRARAARSALLG